MVCPEVARPHVTINRVLKRLARDGWILQVPQPREKQYLYMPNPAIIHPQTMKIPHFLALVDIYIGLGMPEIYEVEPQVNDNYRPDAYTRLGGSNTIIEYQRTPISKAKMQEKVDMFAKSYRKKEHDADTLWIIADREYQVEVPPGVQVIQKKEAAVI